MAERSPAGADELRLHLLVLRCQTGDEQAFARLFEWFGHRTLAHLKGLIGDDAEDVQQEVWLAVYRGISTLSNPGAFRTWLFRTTRHRAIDFLRKRKREMELIEDATAVATSDPAGDDRSLSALDESVLDAAMAGMPPPQREVLVLRYRNDMSYAEIALVVGCPIGTVRTRLHHAKRRLHELLKRGQ